VSSNGRHQLDNYINNDGSYAATLATGVELQQVAGDQHQEEYNNAKESSKKMTTVGHRCTTTRSTPKQRRGRGVVSHCQLQPQEGLRCCYKHAYLIDVPHVKKSDIL
jgi:hypothetical protein